MPVDPEPRGARVLVRMFDDHETPSGLVIPDSAHRPSRGIVTHVGSDQGDLSPGDEVMFFKGKGVELSLDGETLYLLDDAAVLLVLSRRPVRL